MAVRLITITDDYHGPSQREVELADIDPVAVAWARRNLQPWGARVYQGDHFTPCPDICDGRAAPRFGAGLVSPLGWSATGNLDATVVIGDR